MYIICKQIFVLYYVKAFQMQKKQPGLFGIWVDNINKHAPEKFVPRESSRLCSAHFSSDLFEKGYSQKTMLKPYAVPTLFDQSPAQVCYTPRFHNIEHSYTLLKLSYYSIYNCFFITDTHMILNYAIKFC